MASTMDKALVYFEAITKLGHYTCDCKLERLGDPIHVDLGVESIQRGLPKLMKKRREGPQMESDGGKGCQFWGERRCSLTMGSLLVLILYTVLAKTTKRAI